MYKTRITVLKTTFNEDLAKEYGLPGLDLCPCHKVGDSWETTYKKPDGLCGEAWKAIQHYVFALSHGAEFFFGDWIKVPGVAINSCNDGLRPVVFKIERMEKTDPLPAPKPAEA
ncbi:MAG: TIGR04076 family protein [Planctomycetota bacterium]|nr:TIGR04076 family protein [Planctomycetota bacterium]